MTVPTPETQPPETRLTYEKVSETCWGIWYQVGEQVRDVGQFNRNEDNQWSVWLVDAGLGWTKPFRGEVEKALEYLRTGGELGG